MYISNLKFSVFWKSYMRNQVKSIKPHNSLYVHSSQRRQSRANKNRKFSIQLPLNRSILLSCHSLAEHCQPFCSLQPVATLSFCATFRSLARSLFFFLSLSQKQNGAGGREEREESAQGGRRSVKCRRCSAVSCRRLQPRCSE